ncbi:hypothetical protein LJR098_004461 [Rhizobium sp. LjRoot98]|uniref:hypothetical protein n=1 Tax=unclassified Rhizobium TaxID=2613769 RepID=UPI0007132784|nr:MULTISPECIES: hypothetical protein [unclassified Rhizobium]KQV29910.1 hypothetical protein ASC96_10880 [Rhizobium sp. Root1204]KQY04955.1 hypothetical protein ASD36_10830 [Rhizobium sp. Root1334]KRC01600.1 hypothetical protein ASE23_08610 [Rhizobium sp. Root73]
MLNSIKSVLLASLLVLSDMSVGRSESRNLSPTNTIGDILRHPAFSGYAPRVLPWDDRRYDEDMTLNGLQKLLPYHSAVDVQTVLGGLNRIIDDVAGGHQVFYDIYSDEEKRADPTKQNTGLFFFRGKPGAPFAIVSPGGGFAYVGSVHEGFRDARTAHYRDLGARYLLLSETTLRLPVLKDLKRMWMHRQVEGEHPQMAELRQCLRRATYPATIESLVRSMPINGIFTHSRTEGRSSARHVTECNPVFSAVMQMAIRGELDVDLANSLSPSTIVTRRNAAHA